MRRLMAALALLAFASAAAADPQRAPAGHAPLPRLGVAIDVGVPSGAGVVLQGRLLDALRVNAGPMWSGVGFGAKGGLVLAPLQSAVSPTLEIEAGYGVHADLAFLARRSDVPAELRPVLAHASYWYASALVGLDLGSPRGVSFFVRAGLSRVEVQAPRTATTTTGSGTLEIGDSTLRATIPCAKLGVQLWF
jgi:hypothetical protein